MMYIFFWACIEEPKPLPPSRIPQISHAKMIQYGKLRGYLVQKGQPETTLLWTVTELNQKTKACATKQIQNNHTALIIESDMDIAQAQQYLSKIIAPEKFQCLP